MHALKMKCLFIIFLITYSISSLADVDLPRDISKYIQYAEACDHMSGEINGDSSKEDKQTIAETNKYCDIAKNMYEKLNKKYSDNPRIINLIQSYEFLK